MRLPIGGSGNAANIGLVMLLHQKELEDGMINLQPWSDKMLDKQKMIDKRQARPKPSRVFSYIHAEGRLGVLLEIEADTDFCLRNGLLVNFAEELMLQICSMDPTCVCGDAIPEYCTAELECIEFDTKEEHKSKPDNIQKKIIEGKLKAWRKEHVLLEQPWVKDNSIPVLNLLENLTREMREDIEIKNFSRFGK